MVGSLLLCRVNSFRTRFDDSKSNAQRSIAWQLIANRMNLEFFDAQEVVTGFFETKHCDKEFAIEHPSIRNFLSNIKLHVVFGKICHQELPKCKRQLLLLRLRQSGKVK
jgi:hypothetical protein